MFATSVFIKRTPLLKESTKKLYQKLFSIKKPKDLLLEKLYSVPAIDYRHLEHQDLHNFSKPKHRLPARFQPKSKSIYPPFLRPPKSFPMKPKSATSNLKACWS